MMADQKENVLEPPVNQEAEQALLAAILVNNAAFHRVSDFLKPEHFALAVHARIYEAISKLIERGQNANPITLKTMFDQDDALKDVGGAQYLSRLAASVVTIINAEDYGRTIHDLFIRRELMAIGQEMIGAAAEQDLDHMGPQLIEEAEEALHHLAEHGTASRTGFRPVGEVARAAMMRAEQAYKHPTGISGTPTGLIDLDRLLGGMLPGDFIVIGARPSMGKTTLAETIAKHAASFFHREYERGAAPKRAAGFFSQEMSGEKIGAREIAEETGVSTARQRKGDLTHQDFERMVAASNRLATLPYYVDDTPAMNVQRIRHRARRLQRQHGLGLLVIDHLQKMRQGGKTENRRLEIGDITGGLSALAKELGVPLILLSQLSRAVEQRDDKRPTLSDLRESGDIEQDADIVLFLYRHEYYLSREEPARRPEESEDHFNARYEDWKEALAACLNITQIMVAKNRDGPIGKVEVLFNAEHSRFENLAQDRLI